MNTISYLKEIYGYGVPIFLKDIRIGQKSKLSIRKDLSRGVENGDICRESQGIYYFDAKKDFPTVISFIDIIDKKYIGEKILDSNVYVDVFGYYTGLSFLNQIGISQQVPAVIELVTNNTSCKRCITINGFKALLRKPKTMINNSNWKVLQFLDSFYLLNADDIKKHYKTIYEYKIKNINDKQINEYLCLYPKRTALLLTELEVLNRYEHK